MAGGPTVKVSTMPRISKRSWTLSGISIEESSSEKADDTKPRFAEFDQSGTIPSGRKLCLFVTLLIDSTIDNEEVDLLPHSLEDLNPYLLPNQEDRDDIVFGLATAHSFINLSSPAASTMQEKLQLLQQSCTVMCKHVWSSGFERSRSSEKSEAGSFTDSRVEQMVEGASARSARESGDAIKELAAAIVMRIDAVAR